MDIPLIDLLRSPLGMPLKGITDLRYGGRNAEKGVVFEGRREERPMDIIYHTVWSKEDDLRWKAFQELMSHTALAVQVKLRGFFRFDILWIEPDLQALRIAPEEFGVFLANHARTIQPSEKRFIKYSGFYGIFRQTLAEEWGKLDIELPVERIAYGCDRLDLLLKRKSKMFRFNDRDRLQYLIFCDLSEPSLFQPAHDEGMGRLKKEFTKLLQASPDVHPQIYFAHKKETVHFNPLFDER